MAIIFALWISLHHAIVIVCCIFESTTIHNNNNNQQKNEYYKNIRKCRFFLFVLFLQVMCIIEFISFKMGFGAKLMRNIHLQYDFQLNTFNCWPFQYFAFFAKSSELVWNSKLLLFVLHGKGNWWESVYRN